MRYALVIEYNGSNYAGFQIQKNAATVQEQLEKSLAVVLRQFVRISFAGRTDSGVHASGQVISFISQNPISTQKLGLKMNGLLPKDIAVRAVTQVQDDFHPRYSCLAREYEYIIWNHPLRRAFWRKQALWLKQKLPTTIEKLNLELATIIGNHDFRALTPKTNLQDTYIRRVYAASFHKDKELVRFRIIANAFLHNMVRILIGTLIYNKADEQNSLSLKEIISSKDRLRAGPTISPIGLYFRKAYYPPGQEIGKAKDHCLPVWQSSTYASQLHEK